MWFRVYNEYGVVLVLLGLCIFFSFATWAEQHPRGGAAGRQVARKIVALAQKSPSKGRLAIIVCGTTDEERAFASTAEKHLSGHGMTAVAVLQGEPSTVRSKILELANKEHYPEWLACSPDVAKWALWQNLHQLHGRLAHVAVVSPTSYWWPNFLKIDNLLNITNQIAVIAIMAAGMTLVIITGGIDLSVGSLVALSAVLTTLWIRDWAGAESASTLGMTLCAVAATGVCALVGMSTGVLVTLFRRPPQIPPFIVTLAMMLAASGAAYMASQGQSINQVPDSFVWLGRGADLFGIPNAVLLMFLIYVATHVLMTRTTLGRYIYAVGGNLEAARLSGVPVRKVLIAVYTLCAWLAGVGGVVLASQLKSGAPTYGQMYELYVIAAVVVGGTSLSGGQGNVAGTLIGALVIAVIQNGMNLMGLESYTQKIVLGSVILMAVLADRSRRPRMT